MQGVDRPGAVFCHLLPSSSRGSTVQCMTSLSWETNVCLEVLFSGRGAVLPTVVGALHRARLLVLRGRGTSWRCSSTTISHILTCTSSYRVKGTRFQSSRARPSAPSLRVIQHAAAQGTQCLAFCVHDHRPPRCASASFSMLHKARNVSHSSCTTIGLGVASHSACCTRDTLSQRCTCARTNDIIACLLLCCTIDMLSGTTTSRCVAC